MFYTLLFTQTLQTPNHLHFMGKKHNLTLPGRYDAIKKICAFVVTGAEQAGLDESAIFHIELACDEACTNIIEHAYEGENKGDIVVSWQINGDDFLITLQDNGRSFNPDNIPAPSLSTEPTNEENEVNYENLQVGGLGIHFMRKLMDDVSFKFDPDLGNILQLTKKIPARNHTISVWNDALEDDVWIIRVNGRLDQPQTQILEEQLTTLLNEDHAHIVVDLTQATYINSGGLRCLVSAWRKAKKQSGDLYLCGLNKRLEEIMSMVGLNRVFDIYPDIAAAQQAMENRE